MVEVMDGLPNELLNLHRPWTPEEFKKADLVDLQVKEARIKLKGENLLMAKYITPKQCRDAGLFGDMAIIQKHYLDKEYIERMLAVQSDPKNYKKSRGTGFDTAWSTEPNHKFDLSKIAQHHEENTDILQCLASAIIKKHVTHLKEDIYFHQWVKKAAPTYGNEDQMWLTSTQVNVSDIGVNLEIALKAKGCTHTDPNDVPMVPGVILSLATYPPDSTMGFS